VPPGRPAGVTAVLAVEPDPYLRGGGCHVARDTLATIAGAGFTVVRSEAFRFPETRIPAPAAPHVWGIATRDP
jgi:hypothetical protein